MIRKEALKLAYSIFLLFIKGVIKINSYKKDTEKNKKSNEKIYLLAKKLTEFIGSIDDKRSKTSNK